MCNAKKDKLKVRLEQLNTLKFTVNYLYEGNSQNLNNFEDWSCTSLEGAFLLNIGISWVNARGVYNRKIDVFIRGS